MMPIMYLVIFGNAFGGTISHIPVGAVQEVPPYENTQLFTQAVVALNHIPQKDAEKLIDIKVYTDENAAKQDLSKGLLSAVIVFPSAVSNDHAVRLYVDSSNPVIPGLVESAASCYFSTPGQTTCDRL
jgi:ABC-2 type transport system permease protein